MRRDGQRGGHLLRSLCDNLATGPNADHTIDDGPGVVVERDIKASPASVWQFASDINFGADYSSEFVGARWDDPDAEIIVGSSFTGSNQHEAIGTWDVPCFVSSYSPERSFGWVTSDPDNPGPNGFLTSNELQAQLASDSL